MDLRADFTIATIVESLLPRFGSVNAGGEDFPHHDPRLPSKALYVLVQVDVCNFAADQSERRYVHMLFERPSRATRVWSAITEDYFHPEDLSEWKMRSCHDSCWRTDGMVDLNSALRAATEACRPNGERSSLSEFCVIEGVKWAEVTSAPRDPNCTHYKDLTSLKLGKGVSQ